MGSDRIGSGLTVLVGLLPDAVTLLAAHGTLFNLLVVFYMAFTGLNAALCNCIGKHIGAGTAAVAAPRLIALALALAACFASAITVGTYLARYQLAVLFESDQTVVQASVPGPLATSALAS